jgi:hypothetical protein
MSSETTDEEADVGGGRRDGPSVDPARDAWAARIFADARARRLRKIAAGEHVCPPWPEECGREECQERLSRGE